jgi:hypothetical protein
MNAFNAWAREHFAPAVDEHLATDGKCIKANVSDYDQPYQDFVSVVSAFSAVRVVVGLETMHNQQASKIQTVEALLEKLQLKSVCFSLDALHSLAHPKKRWRELSQW